MQAYIGAYTSGQSKGIYLAHCGLMGISAKLAAECVNPSYLAFSPDARTLYAVVEASDYNGTRGGALRCYGVAEDGELTFRNEQLIDGGAPCHVAVNRAGTYAVCSNYFGGFGTVFPLLPDGSIAPSCAKLVETDGTSAVSHVHQAVFTPDESLVGFCDLGLDRVVFYAFDGKAGVGDLRFTLHVPGGLGPRHMVFGEDGYFYVACELGNELLVCHLGADGARIVGRMGTLEAPCKSAVGAIRRASDGKLFVTNRGENTIAVFSPLPGGGISRERNVSCLGDFPRDIAFAPDESVLLCANQNSGTLDAFIYEEGELRETPYTLPIESVCCILWRV